MAESAQPASQTLARLMAEGGWSNRSLAKATETHGRKLGQASIGNIRRGDDTASPDTLAYLAQVMGHPPDAFAEVRLARVRRLFDERAVGLDTADANYRDLEAIFPGATTVDRLIETIDGNGDHEIPQQVTAEVVQAWSLILEKARGNTHPEVPPPATEAVPPGPRRRARRRSA